MAVWTKPYIDRRKAHIKAEIEREAASGEAARLSLILKRVQALEGENDTESRLDRFVWVMSALVHHVRMGGLSNSQIERLVDVGYALLQFQGVKPSKSNISFLFGELHLVRAQIYRNSGQHWRAAWEQQMGLHLSRNAPSGGEDFQHLSLALRSMRLGYLEIARGELDQIDPTSALIDMDQVVIARLRILRLSQDWTGLERYRRTIEMEQLSLQARQELEWELICVASFLTGDLTGMVAAVKRKGSHYVASYIVEAKLWTFAHAHTHYIKLVPKMSTIARVPTLKPQKLGFLFKAAQVLEDAYNANIPLTLRLKNVGDMIANAQQVTTIDKELLLWTSTARWLARFKSFTLAKLALTEYASLSLRMTNGRKRDVLNLVADLQDKPWCQPYKR